MWPSFHRSDHHAFAELDEPAHRALPLILLYELSIRVSVRVIKRQEKRDNEEWS